MVYFRIVLLWILASIAALCPIPTTELQTDPRSQDDALVKVRFLLTTSADADTERQI